MRLLKGKREKDKGRGEIEDAAASREDYKRRLVSLAVFLATLEVSLIQPYDCKR